MFDIRYDTSLHLILLNGSMGTMLFTLYISFRAAPNQLTFFVTDWVTYFEAAFLIIFFVHLKSIDESVYICLTY